MKDYSILEGFISPCYQTIKGRKLSVQQIIDMRGIEDIQALRMLTCNKVTENTPSSNLKTPAELFWILKS